ncbi:ABC transporter ATP-binding protein [Oceanospirillum sediminis]|uniref:ABC transporter ATP-binding protein n=1 Tax=Oceanospirillum sediminis TaxID=2760088 RepID=A0A839IM40_9GAMM|nr:ABC transporter ATP-binding protein [Oceanospirillum sediminis]MBB1485780.1 ABC transporter ATP-binding protein [Oceanospirillum sediminis]
MTLSAENLVLSYSSGQSASSTTSEASPVVSEVSLTLQEGEITCLIGPNGCGKSTLLKALAGLLPPASGQVFLDNRPLPHWSRKAMARRMTLLPQNPVAPDDLSVYQLVSHGRFAWQGLFGRMTQQDLDAVEQALHLTGMDQLRHRSFNTLSGGERQRGWIALALAQQADILLLDEPTTYLDIGHQLEVLELLAQLNREHQRTIVMVLHDINQASQYSDRILAMQQGRIIADDSPVNAITPEMMQQVFGIQVELMMRQQGDKTWPYGLPVGRSSHFPGQDVDTPSSMTGNPSTTGNPPSKTDNQCMQKAG